MNKFIETIKYREVLLKEIEEELGFLSYDLNPIGPPTDLMQKASVINSFESINFIKNKLDEIVTSINESLKDE